MSITILAGRFIAECPKCRLGRICPTEITARIWIQAHVCRGTK